MKRNVFIRVTGIALLTALAAQAIGAEGDANHAAAKAIDSKSGRWATAYPEYTSFSKNLKKISEKETKATIWKDESKVEFALTPDKMNKAWTWAKGAREYRIQLEGSCAGSDKGAKWFGDLMDRCLEQGLGAPLKAGLEKEPWAPAFDAATLSACNQEMEWYFAWKEKKGKLSAGDTQFRKDMKKFYGWFIGDNWMTDLNASFAREKTKAGVDNVLSAGKEIRGIVAGEGYNLSNVCAIGAYNADGGLSDIGGSTGVDCQPGAKCGGSYANNPQGQPYQGQQVQGGVNQVQPYGNNLGGGYGAGGGGFYDPNANQNLGGYGNNIAGLMGGLYNNGKQHYQQPVYAPAPAPGAASAPPPAAAAPFIAPPPPPFYGGGVGVGVGVRKYAPPPAPYPPMPYPQPLPAPVGPPPMPYTPPKKAKVTVRVSEAKPVTTPAPMPRPMPIQIPGRPGWWIIVNGQPIPYNPQQPGMPGMPVTPGYPPVRPTPPIYQPYPPVTVNPINPITPGTPTYPVLPTVVPTFPTPVPTPVTPDPVRNRIPRTTAKSVK